MKGIALASSVLVTAIVGCSLFTDLRGYDDGDPPPDGGSSSSGETASPIVESGTPPQDGSTEASESGAPQPSAYAAAVLADNPIVYLRFDDGEGATAKDSSKTNTNATLSGDFNWSAEGALTNDPSPGIHFTKAAIDLGSLDFTGTAPFTFEIWMKPEVIDEMFRHLFTKDATDSNGRQEIGIALQKDFLIYERYVNSTSQATVFSPSTLLNKWSYVVGTYDGVSLRLYIDGILRDENGDARPQVTKNTPFLVGALEKYYGTFLGIIDEVAIYNTTLSQQQITTHYRVATQTK